MCLPFLHVYIHQKHTGKLCDGYETTVQQENNFISKYTTSFLSDSSFANSYKLLDCFIKDLSITFQQISMGIKKSHISEPLIELEREYDKKYNIICKQYGQSYKKYKLDENNLDSYLSDHKILQKSWQSPRKLNQSIGKFIEAGRDNQELYVQRMGFTNICIVLYRQI